MNNGARTLSVKKETCLAGRSDCLISSIVGENGSEYYAISTDFNPKHANDWVKRNVLSKLPRRFVDFHGSSPNERRQALLWKSNKEIKADLCDLFRCQYEDGMLVAPSGIEIYGYYSDYDWVLFASLFGTMMDLPKGFPMYCRDLKQELDNVAEKQMGNTRFAGWRYDRKNKDPLTTETALTYLKELPSFPKQENEHNALADAKWNYELYKFLQTL